MRLWICISLLFLIVFECSAFEIAPSTIQPGDKVTITGTSDPGTSVPVTMSFETNLPVSDGRYEYLAQDIEVPQKPNTFSVEARGVKDLNLGVKMGIWITKKYDAQGDYARVSQSDVPQGRYNVKIFGTASEGATEVQISVLARTSVQVARDGSYTLTVDTSGVPPGAYRVESGSQSKEVLVGGRRSAASSSGQTNSGSSSGLDQQGEVSRQKVPITPDVARWYAPRINLDPQDPEQLAEAQRRLEMLTKDGSWIVIARGAELAEQYGNCQDVYCLDRGSVCRPCRDRDRLAKARVTSENASQDEEWAIKSDLDQSLNLSASPSGASTFSTAFLTAGFSDLIDRILRLFGWR